MTRLNTNCITRIGSAAAFLTAASSVQAANNERIEQFLTDIKSENPDTRYDAVKRAGTVGARVVPQLGDLLDSENPGIAKSACEALRTHVHGAAKNWDRRKRANVMNALIRLLENSPSKKARVEALRHLSTIGDADAVPPVAELLTNKELQEEAAYCLERIPGEESTKALLDALLQISGDFKLRILAALGYRKDQSAVKTLGQLMESSDPAVTIPAMKALSIIGAMPGDYLPSPASEREKAMFADSWLRFLDTQIEQGHLEHYEETLIGLLESVKTKHYQCAVLISLGKSGSAKAVDAVLTRIDSEFPDVRHAAREALIAMKGSEADRKIKEVLPKAEGETKKTLQAILDQRR